MDEVPLYDRALIGGADHIIAHATAGQIPHNCITKSFTEDIEEVNKWSKKFYNVVEGKIGYVKGDLYHIWHGDISKREYLKRIQDFTPVTKQITTKDENGLYITKKGDDKYIKDYFNHREVTSSNNNTDDGFLQSMLLGYMTNSTMMGSLMGGNPLGAMIGDMMNNSEDQHSHQSVDGGGSTTNWDNTPTPDNNQPYQVDSIPNIPISDSTNINVPDPNTFS